MTSQPFDLHTLQSWMQSLMLDTADTQSDRAAASVDEVITASSQQTSRQRLEVYCNAYQARLLECLREEFATLSQFLGQDVFDSLALAYLEAHPSQSYTLAQLGAAFPQFLQDTADSAVTVDSSESPFSGTQFLIDLATLERLYAEVFDGPGIEGLPLIIAEALQTISPAAWPEVRFEPAPCLRLVEFAYPVHEFVTACRHGTEPPIPEPHHTRLAVTRRQYIVRRVVLSEQQFHLLHLLSQGVPLGSALDEVAVQCEDIEAFTHDITHWFQDWTAAGFFQAIVTDTRPLSKNL
jgi:hypothetical protein